MGDISTTDCTRNDTETKPVQIVPRSRFEWIMRAFVAFLLIIAGVTCSYIANQYGTLGGFWLPVLAFILAAAIMNN